MKHLWTWGGTYFGYLQGNSLWTHRGKHVGVLNYENIFSRNGTYLGEIMNDRLITNISKKNIRGPVFTPYANHVSLVPFVNYVGYVMVVGYEDFPGPEAF